MTTAVSVAFKTFCVFTFFNGATLFSQNDYVIVLERGHAEVLDDKYLSAFSIRTFRYNRTNTALNMTLGFAFDVGRNVLVHTTAFKMASNQYRPFPFLEVTLNLCEICEGDKYGLGSLITRGNLTCPIKKGKYFFQNWYLEYWKFPPHVPSGNYLLRNVLVYDSKDIGVIDMYGNIVR